jgi:hypothetical protein
MTEQATARDITPITDFKTEQMYFGELDGFPHMYLIRSSEPFTLKAEILLPDIEKTPRDINGIIIRDTGFQGRIQEMTRMLAKDASWESFYDLWGGDRYLRGTTYKQDVESGVYRIEVSSPNNEGKYVLIVGNEDSFGSIGYFELIGRLSAVKSFFGKSPLRMIEAPLVFIPLLLIVCGVLWWRLRRTRKIA